MADATQSKRAVFLDRDGTLNRETEYLHKVENFEWIPGARNAIRRLTENNFHTLVVTNQAGVARGYYSVDDVERLHRHMETDLAKKGTRIDAFYYAPHHPQGEVPAYTGNHEDRKPGTGMFEQGLSEWNLEPENCFVVGDKESDLIPGKELGMTTLLVQTGYGPEYTDSYAADYVVADIEAAVAKILELCDTTL